MCILVSTSHFCTPKPFASNTTDLNQWLKWSYAKLIEMYTYIRHSSPIIYSSSCTSSKWNFLKYAVNWSGLRHLWPNSSGSEGILKTVTTHFLGTFVMGTWVVLLYRGCSSSHENLRPELQKVLLLVWYQKDLQILERVFTGLPIKQT